MTTHQIKVRDLVQQMSGPIGDIGSVCQVVAINGKEIRVRYSDGALPTVQGCIMRTILSAIALTATAAGCLAPQSTVATADSDLSQAQAAPQVPLAPALARELVGATYCTANNPVEIDNTQLCLHVESDGRYSLTTDYLWEQGVIDSDIPGLVSFYPADRTDLVLSPDGSAYTVQAFHMGDNLLLVTQSLTLPLNLTNP